MIAKQKSETHYETTWNRVGSIVSQEIDTGRKRSEILSTILRKVSGDFLANQPFLDYYRETGCQFDKSGRPTERIIVRNGEYRLVPFQQFDDIPVSTTLTEFLDAHQGQIDCIVELGSGFGKNLFNLYSEICDRNIQIPLHACELTAGGRQVTEQLRGIDSKIPLSIHAFDYYKPDFSFLDAGVRALFFTVHSIEQIPNLGQAVFEQMLNRTSDCNCFHFEPVGWQTDDRLVQSRQRHNSSLTSFSLGPRTRIGRLLGWKSSARQPVRRGFPGIVLEHRDIGSSRMVAANGAAWSARGGYNTNLIKLLRGLATQGKIAVERESFDEFGLNPFNPTSIIHWSRARSDSRR